MTCQFVTRAQVSQPSAGSRFGVRMAVECVPQTREGGRLASVEWSKQEGGADRHKQERHGDRSTLILEALSSMDLGTYVCIARQQDGQVAQNEIVFENQADHGAYFHYKIRGPSETVSETLCDENKGGFELLARVACFLNTLLFLFESKSLYQYRV